MRTKKIFSILLLWVLIGCSVPNHSEENNVTRTSLRLEQVLPGVWSIDSAGQLTNTGFYFRDDGSVEFAGTDKSGRWLVIGDDQFCISLMNGSTDTLTESFAVDSVTADRLAVKGREVAFLLRKVPYGEGIEQNVLSGFMGRLTRVVSEKNYTVSIPSSKKITIELKSQDPALAFELLSPSGPMTLTPVRSWSSVVILGGEFSLKIKSSDPSRLTADGSEFDVKVFVQ